MSRQMEISGLDTLAFRFEQTALARQTQRDDETGNRRPTRIFVDLAAIERDAQPARRRGAGDVVGAVPEAAALGLAVQRPHRDIRGIVVIREDGEDEQAMRTQTARD